MTPSVGNVLRDLLAGTLDEIRRGSGPVKWCKRCGRKHATRARCGLRTVSVQAKSGRKVQVQRHHSRPMP